jgi:tetratricopeptide (TPR) repeat protein
MFTGSRRFILVFGLSALMSFGSGWCGVDPAQATEQATVEEDSLACDMAVEGAFEEIYMSNYQDALQRLQHVFAMGDASERCLDHSLAVESWAYLNMGDRSRARDLLERLLLSRNLHPCFESYRFTPDLCELYRAVRDSIGSRGTMDIRTVAVLDFDIHNAANLDFEGYRWDQLAKGLQMMLTMDLASGTDLVVVDRRHMKEVLAELAIASNRDLADPAQAVRLGQVLNAHALIYGQIVIIDKDYIEIEVSVQHVATSRVTGSKYIEDDFQGRPGDLVKMQKALLLNVVRHLDSFRKDVQAGVPINVDRSYVDEMDRKMRQSKGEVEIWLLESKALDLEEDGEFTGAIETWRKVLALDPEHKLARARIYSLQREGPQGSG